ncbi:SHOCT domain-containing protein [Hymenobacter aquaticus]|uniref:SHOCT domain-containing protein n=2 Tax=Hymenobacter aquaticus TaxID=1867101 RepID=A0A4Z0Q9Q8_9BACT|nr:SHOCT domain-containing protein [Hymenobacter aquaticus]
MGTTFHKGDTIFFDMGTTDGGAFKYAYIPPNFLIGLPETHYGSAYNNNRLVIKDIRAQAANKRMAPRTVAVVSPGGVNGCVDLESAEAAGEIKTKNNRKPAAAAQAPAASTADELLKLKGLLDAGVLTKEEFEQQKAKLLSK